MSSSFDPKVIARQTSALFLDAYRELNAKRLFWITLWLSLVVVVAFAFISITPRGIKMFAWEIPGPWNTSLIPADTFYKFLFTQWAIPWWLGVAASILALISVASIFPDFISGGSIDLYLARPISRLRLFLTKYLASLLFVALQVFVFSLASFFVIGIKGHVWEFGIFLAVPLVTLFFSYLYCMCVLIGLMTRSTLAAILFTLLLWFFLFALSFTDAVMLLQKSVDFERVIRIDNNIETWNHWIAQHKSLPSEKQSAGALKNFEFQRDKLVAERMDAARAAELVRFWQELITGIRTPLPKTGETVDLMTRWLVEPDPIMKANRQAAERRHERKQTWRAIREQMSGAHPSTTKLTTEPAPALERTEVTEDDPDVLDDVNHEFNARSTGRIVGTSVAFEAVVLLICAWLFCRRDF